MLDALRRVVPTLALAGLLASCGPGPGTVMTAAPVPEGWESALLEDRAAKDEEMRLDPDSPIHPDDRSSFGGLSYWDPDPAYHLSGPIERYEQPERFTIITTTGKERPCEKYGRILFELDGRRQELQVYRLLDAPDTATATDRFFLPFKDATSGTETYPAGRYVNLAPLGDGRYVLDFNRAHNPLCAYGRPENYVCPVTPRENRLAIRVEAGERGYRGAPAGS
jgi:uncharacterized protein (DUF1684 family)